MRIIELEKLFQSEDTLDQAIQECKEAIMKNKSNHQLYISLASLYIGIGDREKARETILQILQINPYLKLEVEGFLKTI